MSEPVLFVSMGVPNAAEPEALDAYVGQVSPLLSAAGGQPKVRAKLVEQLVGANAPQTLFVAEFPSAEAARAVFESDAYKALIPTRKRAFKNVEFFLVAPF